MDTASSLAETMLADGGECGALLRAHDWAQSPLRHPVVWPAELAALVPVMLGSMQPTFLVWGPQRTLVYNDGFAAMCGNRHPSALGRPVDELWDDNSVIRAILADAAQMRGSRLEELAFTSRKGLVPASYTFSFTPIRSGGEVLGYYCVCVETTGQMLSRRAAADEISRLKQMFRHAPSAMALLEGPDHVLTYANEAFFRLFNKSQDIVGARLADAFPDLAPPILPHLDAVVQTGVPYIGRNAPAAIERARGVVQHWVDFVYQPMWDEDGRISGIFAQLQDVSDRAIAEKQQEVLNREIAHRMKNQLAVVNSIVTQSLRSAGDLASARASISGRIAALARAQTDLVLGGETAGDVRGVLAGFLAVHGDERIVAEGANVPIASKPALSLALILHELATNAAKYGALTAAEGAVRIEWQVDGETFVLRWIERGGPPVQPPQKASAGSRLIRAGLAGVTRCAVHLDYAAEGLSCTIEADAASVSREPAGQG